MNFSNKQLKDFQYSETMIELNSEQKKIAASRMNLPVEQEKILLDYLLERGDFNKRYLVANYDFLKPALKLYERERRQVAREVYDAIRAFKAEERRKEEEKENAELKSRAEEILASKDIDKIVQLLKTEKRDFERYVGECQGRGMLM